MVNVISMLEYLKKRILYLKIAVPLFLIMAETITGQVDWTWRTPLPQGNELYSVTFGNSFYVAVGAWGSMINSPDGEAWAVLKPLTKNHLRSVSCYSEQYIAVGDTGKILVSGNGSDWADRSKAGQNLNSVCGGMGMYVAVGDSGTILISVNANEWNVVESGTKKNLKCVSFGLNKFIVGGENGTMLKSSDGKTWSTLDPLTNNNLNSAIYAGEQFVIVGDTGVILTSPDCNEWTCTTFKEPEARSGVKNLSPTLRSVTRFDSLFVISGDYGTILTSKDSKTWSEKILDYTPLSVARRITSVAGGNNGIVALQDIAILKSDDGVSWKKITTDLTGYYMSLKSVAYGNGKYVAVGTYKQIAVSDDGLKWELISWSSNSADYHIYKVLFADGRFFAVGMSGVIRTSEDGRNWTAYSLPSNFFNAPADYLNDMYDITYGNGKFVAACYLALISSTDGTTWEEVKSTGQLLSHQIVFGNNRFVTYNHNNFIVSEDATTWIKHPMPDTGRYGLIRFCNDRFVFIYGSGGIYTSADGSTWEYMAQKPGGLWYPYDLTFSKGRYVLIGEKGNMFLSNDLVNWTSGESGTGYSLNEIICNDGLYVMAGSAGILTSIEDTVHIVSKACRKKDRDKCRTRVVENMLTVGALPIINGKDVSITIYNIAGKKIHSMSGKPVNGLIKMPVNGLSAGRYFLSVTAGNTMLLGTSILVL